MTDSTPESLLPIAPSLDHPLEILEACHGRIEAQLKTLERLLPHLHEHGVDTQARQAAQAILRYFDSAARHHHEDEEENLFPVLMARAGVAQEKRVQSLINDLLADHARMATALAPVRQQLLAILDGSSTDLDESAVRLLAGRYRQHIARENSELLSLARTLLSIEDIEALSRAMTARRSPKP